MRFSELQPSDIISDSGCEVVLVCSIAGDDIIVLATLPAADDSTRFIDWRGDIGRPIDVCGWRHVIREGKDIL